MAKASGDESEPKENDKLNNPGNGDNGANLRGPVEVTGKESTRTQLMLERWDSAKTFISENFYRVILVLTALVLILLFVVLTLAIILGTRGTITFPMKCESASCLKAAAVTLSNLDLKNDQCENFWSYSCGNWIKNNKIPPERGIYSVKDGIRHETNLKILNLLHTLPASNQKHGFDTMRRFYETCMDLDRVDHDSKKFVDDYLVAKLGGWAPMHRVKLDWHKVLEYLQIDYGVAPFFRISVETNDYDPTAPTIKISPPEFGLPSREHYWNPKYEKIQQRYRSYILEVCKQVGVNPAQGQRAADMIFNYERKLIEFVSDTWNVSQLLERTKIRDLRAMLPNIKWIEFMQTYSDLNDLPFKDNTQVVIVDKKYLRSLVNILSPYADDVINTFLIWKFIHEYAPYMNEDVRNIQIAWKKSLNGVEQSYEKEERWEFCVETLKKFYGQGLTSLLIDKNDVSHKFLAVEQLLERVRNKIKERLVRFPWVTDRETSERLRDKLDMLNVKLGYPEGLPDGEGMEKYYLSAVVDSSLIKSVSNAYSFQRKKLFQTLLKSSTDVWPFSPFEPEVHYQYAGNILYVGFGIMTSPIYEHDFPLAMNYGSLSFHIASEMFKAISFRGVFYDRNGQFSEGFTIITEEANEALNSSTACLAEKLMQHNVTISDQVNIDLILPQTVIDIDALQIAYEAYMQLVTLEGQEHPLPGLSLYNDQLFYVSFAQSLCESVRDGYADNYFQIMKTLPGKLRVETVTRNIPQFLKSFNCRSQESIKCPK